MMLVLTTDMVSPLHRMAHTHSGPQPNISFILLHGLMNAQFNQTIAFMFAQPSLCRATILCFMRARVPPA